MRPQVCSPGQRCCDHEGFSEHRTCQACREPVLARRGPEPPPYHSSTTGCGPYGKITERKEKTLCKGKTIFIVTFSGHQREPGAALIFYRCSGRKQDPFTDTPKKKKIQPPQNTTHGASESFAELMEPDKRGDSPEFGLTHLPLSPNSCFPAPRAARCRDNRENLEARHPSSSQARP